MELLAGRIVLITGIMAAGKSTVAELLAQRLNRSVHLRGDVFRKMIVNGREEMSGNANAEALRQLNLRYDLSVDVALRYADEGFTVIYQDVILGEHLSQLAARLRPGDYVFVLCPAADAVAERETVRVKKGYHNFSPLQLDDVLRNQTERLGCWLDSTGLTPEETVEQMLKQLAAAVVEARPGRG